MTASEELFEIRSRDVVATGYLVDGGFLVKKGSMARTEVGLSFREDAKTIHRDLINDGTLIEEENCLRFARDKKFNSPSSAASLVLGRQANGWTEWKLPDGTTLSTAKRVIRVEQASILNKNKRQEIMQRCDDLIHDDKVLSKDQLAKEYAIFRERFGPKVLASLEGEELLSYMHDIGNQDSLVYWLEYKNDEEFKTKKFGSISGGSALKYRIFRRRETGTWQAAGTSGNHTKDLSVDEAIEIATTHRDQLLRGVGLLESLPVNAGDVEYAQLQDDMDEVATDVSRLAWGHKYFSLIFPDKLDDFHSIEWQRYHLLKLLQMPPEDEGRYTCAGRFVSAAKEVGLPIHYFTATLNSVHGGVHRYWRIGTTLGPKSLWPEMRDKSFIGIAWQELGDLSWVERTSEKLEKLKKLLAEKYTVAPQVIGNFRSQITQFVDGMKQGDVVVAAEGTKVLGIGRISGDFEYHPESDFPNQRKVDWISIGEWALPVPSEGNHTAVRELKKYNENIIAIERRIQETGSNPDLPPKKDLQGIPGRIQSVLERKGQVILYGPPGTGKTYWAEQAANDLAAMAAFGRRYEELSDQEKRTVVGHGETSGLVRMCCFHPAYGYEDFLEGYRPKSEDGQISFELRAGVFKKLCQDALASPKKRFYLIVDEINRGDIPRIFGELLTTLEKDKRGKRLILPVSQEVFFVPSNVYLIGTMNTADRSISLMDAALRRRFGFVEIMPDGGVLKGQAVQGIAIQAWFEAINARIRQHIGRDARNLQIGHSYLMHAGNPLRDIASLKRAIRDDIIPLLEEYCYDNYGTLLNILGDQLVDSKASRIRHELFEEGQENAFVQGLLSNFPEISTLPEAILADGAQTEPEGGDDGEAE